MAMAVVPVVGCADRHSVDVVPLEQLAVVGIGLAAALVVGREALGMLAVDVATGDHIFQVACLVADGRAASVEGAFLPQTLR